MSAVNKLPTSWYFSIKKKKKEISSDPSHQVTIDGFNLMKTPSK